MQEMQDSKHRKYVHQVIGETYDQLTYLDLYGQSVLVFVLVTIVVILVFVGCKVVRVKEQLAKNWVAERCKPMNLPFAGWINAPKGTSAVQYTKDNFHYCLNQILQESSSTALQPYQYMLSSLTQIFGKMGESLNQTREASASLRNGIGSFASNVMGRLLNIVIPIQTMFIALMDTFQKIQGVMTASLYTMMGSYNTLQSLMGAIIELIIKLLVVMAALIVGLWASPVTFPAAASMSAVFVSISVPLAIIVAFMSQVLHVKTGAKIPKLPKMRCFDPYTPIPLLHNQRQYMKDIKPGTVLADGSYVTATMKVTAKDLPMFQLNGTIVSGNHMVYYKPMHGLADHDANAAAGRWISVSDHPLAKPIPMVDYKEAYVYCLNTSNKQIQLGDGLVYADWDELYGENLEFVLSCNFIERRSNISKSLDRCFHRRSMVRLLYGSKRIDEIRIGDHVWNGGIVYGIVCVHQEFNTEPMYNLLVTSKCFDIGPYTHMDYNHAVDALLDLKKILSV